jgi:hypothetical protein
VQSHVQIVASYSCTTYYVGSRSSRDRGRRRLASAHRADPPMIGLLSLRLAGEVASYILGFSRALHSLYSCFGHILRIASHRSCISLHSLSLWYLFFCKFAANLHIQPPHQTTGKSAASCVSRAGIRNPLTTRPNRGQFVCGLRPE